MNRFFITSILGLSLALVSVGCKGGASCEDVVDHTLELMPEEMRQNLGDKKPLIEKCEKELSEDERKCAMEAKDLGALGACRKK